MLNPVLKVRAYKSTGLVSALCHRSEVGTASSSKIASKEMSDLVINVVVSGWRAGARGLRR